MDANPLFGGSAPELFGGKIYQLFDFTSTSATAITATQLWHKHEDK